jgi:hypothetical protein
MDTDYVDPKDFIAYVRSRGYRVSPLLALNGHDAGLDLVINGYELRGPRNNKKIVIKNKDGLLSLFDARLWCDGVDYATARVQETLSRKRNQKTKISS